MAVLPCRWTSCADHAFKTGPQGCTDPGHGAESMSKDRTQLLKALVCGNGPGFDTRQKITAAPISDTAPFLEETWFRAFSAAKCLAARSHARRVP